MMTTTTTTNTHNHAKPPPATEDLLARLNQALPWSDEAEKGVLSCLLQFPRHLDEAPAPDTYYHDGNRRIAAAIAAQHAAGRPVDPVLLTQLLRDSGQLDLVGGPAALVEIAAFIPIPAHFPYYTAILREKHQLRRMIGALALGIVELQGFASQGQDGRTVADCLSHVQQLVCEALNDDGSPDLPSRPIGELLQEVLDQAENHAQNPGAIPGLSTGIEGVDEVMGGLEAGCLTVIAAESSDGKSALARQMLEAVCAEGHHAVDYTYEMHPVVEARRVMCSRAGIDSTHLKRGLMSTGEMKSFAAHFPRISAWNLEITDVAGKTIEQICRDIARRSRRLPAGRKLVAMIDYIQLCKTSLTQKNNREREVAHITATAKQCARLTGAHIIMPSQQNKEGDVRESMAIEQDADTLIKIQKIAPASGTKPWQQQQQHQQSSQSTTTCSSAAADEKKDLRDLFFHKVRDGEKHRSVRARLLGRYFRFN